MGIRVLRLPLTVLFFSIFAFALFLAVLATPALAEQTPTVGAVDDGCSFNGSVWHEVSWTNVAAPDDGFWSIWRAPQGPSQTFVMIATVGSAQRLFYDTDPALLSGSYQYAVVDGEGPAPTSGVVFSPSTSQISTERTCPVVVKERDAQAIPVSIAAPVQVKGLDSSCSPSPCDVKVYQTNESGSSGPEPMPSASAVPVLTSSESEALKRIPNAVVVGGSFLLLLAGIRVMSGLVRSD